MELKFIDKSDPESKQNRVNAKVFNFRMIYGGSAYGFYKDPKMPNFSKRKWEKAVEAFNTKYSGFMTTTIGTSDGFLVMGLLPFLLEDVLYSKNLFIKTG